MKTEIHRRHNTDEPFYSPKVCVRHSFKVQKPVIQPKRHNIKVKLALMSHKRRFCSVVFANRYLPGPDAHIE